MWDSKILLLRQRTRSSWNNTKRLDASSKRLASCYSDRRDDRRTSLLSGVGWDYSIGSTVQTVKGRKGQEKLKNNRRSLFYLWYLRYKVLLQPTSHNNWISLLPPASTLHFSSPTITQWYLYIISIASTHTDTCVYQTLWCAHPFWSSALLWWVGHRQALFHHFPILSKKVDKRQNRISCPQRTVCPLSSLIR